jgi:hypothetical protein
MTTKPTWQDTLAALKPSIKTVPKIEVRRKVSLRRDSCKYEIRYIEPRWDRESMSNQTSHSVNF